MRQALFTEYHSHLQINELGALCSRRGGFIVYTYAGDRGRHTKSGRHGDHRDHQLPIPFVKRT